jgi:hypothetical protein
VRRVLLIVAGALALAGCTSSGPVPAGPTITRTVIEGTRTHHHKPPKDYTPPPASSVAPLPPGAEPPKGERAKPCPYLKAGLNTEPTAQPNIAALEGDRVGRITVLTRRHPVGCRFYFAYSPYEAIADVLPTRFASKDAAYNAMIRTARAGGEPETYKNFVKGVTGIRYRTKFYGPDGKKDWAFVFAKGKVMVVVHTQQTNASLNGQAIAEAIVGRF